MSKTNIGAAIRSLLENWQRASLSAVGIMVASIAILLLISIGKGVQKDITSQVEEIGANVLIVVPGRVDLGNFNPNLGGKSYLSDQNVSDIRTIPGVLRIAKWSFAGGGIRYKDRESFPFMIASSPEWFQMQPFKLQAGSLYKPEESKAAVCVLGSIAAAQLFPDEPAVGKSVEINGFTYKVVGVTEDKKADQSLFSMQSLANVAYFPIDALRANTENVQIDRLLVQVSPDAEPKALVKSVEDALGKRLDRQQYSVLTQEDLLGLIFKVMGILTTLVIGLTSIALFVGGVGVMTVMLMSVNERSKEIGVRKATGARQRDIFGQFLVESITIGFVGVGAGFVISLIVCYLLTNFTKIKPLMTWDTIAIAVAVGLGIGSIFGLIPAMKAARKDPVAALRNE